MISQLLIIKNVRIRIGAWVIIHSYVRFACWFVLSIRYTFHSQAMQRQNYPLYELKLYNKSHFLENLVLFLVMKTMKQIIQSKKGHSRTWQIDYYPRELDYIPISTKEFVQNFLDHYITFSVLVLWSAWMKMLILNCRSVTQYSCNWSGMEAVLNSRS